MFITVFTPTYNRRHTLTYIYDSLKSQTYKNFEWLIVDDGSSDDTDDLVDRFINEKPFFSIVFIKNEHGGKHRAVNRGLDVAKGELFLMLDSDDYLTSNALNIVNNWANKIPNKDECAGLCGMMANEDGKPIGTQFSQAYIYMTLAEMIKSGIKCDHADILFTKIFKKYKYPEIKGEWHIAPGVPFIRMAKDNLKLLFFNEVIYITRYMQDGLTNMGERKIIENFKGYTLRTKELLEADIGFKRKFELIGKYSYLARKKNLSYKDITINLQKNVFVCYIGAKVANIYFKNSFFN